MNSYKLYFYQCLRSKAVIISLLMIFTLGIMSIIIGKEYLQRQQDAIAQVQAYQKEHLERQVSLHNEDLGLLLYYAQFAYIYPLNPLAGVSIGQGDINPTIKRITIKTFEGQKYDTDLVNPTSLQSGNLDLSFVIIYLFPLLIIVLTYNVISEETENGTWRLVAIQSRSKIIFLLSKLGVRFLILLLVLTLLLLVTKFVLKTPFDFTFFKIILVCTLYILFWFTLSFFVVLFKKSSGLNALTLLCTWLILIILIPAGINGYISYKYPLPEALSTVISQRDGYHTKWDTDKRETIEEFYDHYPQFKKYGYPTEGFNWLWYYAMQQMGDDHSAESQKELEYKIQNRERLSSQIAAVIPNMHLQLTLNQLAGTSMQQHMQYLEGAKKFHEKLRLFFYPKVFEEKKAEIINWDQFTPEYYSSRTNSKTYLSFLPLMLATLLLILISIPQLRKL